MKKLKERCAFTLVELIVVLVILAILAALLIPALTGYIDKAKKKQVIAETRMLHEAIQTEMVEWYGTDTWPKLTGASSWQDIAQKNSSDRVSSDRYDAIVKLSEVPSLQAGTGSFIAYVGDDGKVWSIMYRDGKGHFGLYFGETQEYLAFDESEVPNYAHYLQINGVRYTNHLQPYTDSNGNKQYDLSMVLQKDLILATIK